MPLPPSSPRPGFETPPLGRLLEQLVVLDTPVGLAYERSVGFVKEPHIHDRAIIIAPKGACRMEVRTRRPDGRFQLDATTILYVPAGIVHSDHGLSAVYDTMALLPNAELTTQLVTENGLGDDAARRLARECIKLKRSRWLDDILDRYFFERVLNASSPVGCVFFLEKQILNEFARLAFADQFRRYGHPVDALDDDLATSALKFIESSLFEPLRLDELCRKLRTSDSTLLRAFRKNFGTTPLAYVKARRLDEAARLLRLGDLRVSDVCLLVGYEDFSAFTRAFRQTFGVPPSAYKDLQARLEGDPSAGGGDRGGPHEP